MPGTKNRYSRVRTLLLLCTLLALAVSLAAPIRRAQAEDGAAEVTIEGQTVGPLLEDLGDNADLLDVYVEQRFDQEIPSVQLSAQSSDVRLSGYDAAIYELLYPMIEEVAAGKRASTEFELDLEEVFGQVSFTADELGVESIFEGGSISQDAIDAVSEIYHYELRNVLDALTVNCPYDLYWFDKTSGVSSGGYRLNAHSGYEGDEYVERLLLVGPLVIKMTVANDYAIDTYTVDTSTGMRVEDAVTRAKAVAFENEDLDAYTRLAGFKDAICADVSYDHDAAEGGVAYGDPWQLVSVFDGDDSTNVVCEGYSKAFKYLCDLADMDGIECRLPTGVMSGGEGAGNHMWNIVQMDDGLNYLVDVTNCDEGTIGADDLLFLVPYATGTVDEGYTFEPNDQTISYVYSENTTRYFTTEELTLSSTPYDKDAANEPTEGWTAFGGCEWRIEGDTMTIRPLRNGTTGTLADTNGSPMPGVYDPAVRHVVFADGVKAARNMVSLFDGATNLESIDFGNFDTSKCAAMTGMFGDCSALTELDLSKFDTSNVEYMSDMFGGCSSLENVNLSSFDTHLVTDMSTMFRFCSSLTELDLSHFDTTNVANFYDMFRDCTSLATLDISSFDATNGQSWSNMFNNCPSLSELTVGESWRFSVGDMMAEPTNERGWYSTTDKKWYSKEEIVSLRSGVADTYANWAPKVKLDGAKVELAEGPYVYAGVSIKPVASVTLNGVKLSESVDYTVSYENNVNAGEASYVVEGVGDYEGSLTGSFQIEPRELVVKTPSGTKTYDGSALTNDKVVVEGQAEGDEFR